MTDELAALRRRLEALRQMTAANGCTEEEALTAARLADELLRRHGLDEDQVLNAEAVRRRTKRFRTRDLLADLIARRCRCQLRWRWIETRTYVVRPHVVYQGRAADVAVAEYLHDVMHRAVETAIAGFRRTRAYRNRRSRTTREGAVRAFESGFVWGLIARLHQLGWVPEPSPEATAAAAAEPEGTPAERRRWRRMARGQRRYDGAYWAGHVAGNQVALNAGVTGDGDQVATIGSGGA